MNKISTFYGRIKKYLVNTSWIMSERLMNMGITFLVTILVARYLGPAQFGILSYAISFVALFAVAGHVGLSGLVVRELVRHPEAKEEIMGTSFILKLAGYLIGLCSLLIFTFVTEDKHSPDFWILIILSTSLLFQPFNVIDFWFQSRLEAKYTAVSQTVSILISSAIKIALVLIGAKLMFFALANVIQAITATLLFLLFYRYKSKQRIKLWRVSRTRAKELFSQGWMVFLGSIFAIINIRVDQVMLKWLVGSKEVGIYSVAATLSEAWYFIPVAISASFFPKLIKLKESEPALYRKRLQQIFDLLFMLALTVAIAVTFLAQPIITMMFGKAYTGSTEILIVHIWAGLFMFMRAAFSRWILIENALMFSLITQGMGAVVNVLLNLVLIPEYSGLGAAYATLISYAIASYIALLFYSKTRPVFKMMTKAMLAPIRYLNVIKRIR